MSYGVRILLYLSFLLPLSIWSQENNWELKKMRNGIQVYTRTIPNSTNKEYKAVVTVKSSMEKAVTTLLDGNNLYEWNHQTPESKTIRKINEHTVVIWMKNQTPWPIPNRDHIARLEAEYLNNYTVKISITPEKQFLIPTSKNVIRMEDFKGFWLVVDHGNQLIITQQLYGDAGGNLPDWLVNSALTTAPYNTLLNLKNKLETTP
ncbi:START domain-containing protein [Imtechella halotolerans]|nr:START domain-containing protein [Imtechella halotolerans]WMQ62841.1 START domain-containing protein [Imtechella halotolerans]